MTVIVLLSMPAGRLRALAFVVGWVIAIVAIGAVSAFLLHGQDFTSRTTSPSRAASALEILVGAVLLVASVRALRRRAERAPTNEAPRWVGALDRTHWLLATVAGAFMLTYSLTLAAAAEILRADVSTADDLVAFGAFALASVSTIVAPIVLVLAVPDRSAERLARWRAWLLGHSRTIGLLALMVIGVLLIVRGAYDLAA